MIPFGTHVRLVYPLSKQPERNGKDDLADKQPDYPEAPCHPKIKSTQGIRNETIVPKSIPAK